MFNNTSPSNTSYSTVFGIATFSKLSVENLSVYVNRFQDNKIASDNQRGSLSDLSQDTQTNYSMNNITIHSPNEEIPFQFDIEMINPFTIFSTLYSFQNSHSISNFFESYNIAVTIMYNCMELTVYTYILVILFTLFNCYYNPEVMNKNSRINVIIVKTCYLVITIFVICIVIQSVYIYLFYYPDIAIANYCDSLQKELSSTNNSKVIHTYEGIAVDYFYKAAGLLLFAVLGLYRSFFLVAQKN